MINFEMGQKWAKALKEPTALKGESFLQYEKDGFILRCCLGTVCEMVGLKSVISPNIDEWIDFQEGSGIYNRSLPPRLAKDLNILFFGELTIQGSTIAGSLFNLSLCYSRSLAYINDNINDKTLFRIGTLIEALMCEEYLFGRECFQDPRGAEKLSEKTLDNEGKPC